MRKAYESGAVTVVYLYDADGRLVLVGWTIW